MKKIIITADSTCDLSLELQAANNIVLIPLFVNLGERQGRDGIDLMPDDIYKYVEETGNLPFTSAIPPAIYSEIFQEKIKDGAELIHLSISSAISSCYQNAVIAANELSGVYVVDTKNLSTGSGHLVLLAAEMVKSGMSAEDIVKKLNEIALRVDASFVIDSLAYLRKGGRCSALAALGANLLKLKPCIEVKDGKMSVGKKYRGNFNDILSQYVNDRLSNIEELDNSRIFITHAGCSAESVKIVEDIVSSMNYFKEILVTRAGCTISTHCGANTIGILYIRKNNKV